MLGCGVDGGRHITSHSSGPAISNAPGTPTTAGSTSVVQTSSSVSGKALPKPAQVPTAPLQPPPMIYCEICKIECNSPEIIEQHKNGKRHKKNMKAHQPKNVQKSEKKECPTENLGSETTANNH
ncbi:Zinc finger C2H2 superfamily [Sesbania bispinosa]|nr:Zinc finger C2H2 superfamily [Sesbania bispinosa]